MERQDDLTASRLAEGVAALLGARGETLAVVESSTGGLIMSLLTDIPGASAWFMGGVVAYTNRVKEEVLGLSPDGLARHGAASPETARDLARGGVRLFGATWTLAETGVAGPRGNHRSTKPVGVTYLALVGTTPGGLLEQAAKHHVADPDDRAAVKRAFAAAALGLLIDTLGAVPLPHP